MQTEWGKSMRATFGQTQRKRQMQAVTVLALPDHRPEGASRGTQDTSKFDAL